MTDTGQAPGEAGIPLAEANIIVCWSGEIGRQVARQVAEWLIELDNEGFRPFHSDDLEKGEDWRTALREKLARVKAGIVCVTPGALASPWIHFEAGHLTRLLMDHPASPAGPAGKTGTVDPGADSGRRVLPFLFRVKKSNLEGPLADYQATEADAADVNRLLESLGRHLGVKVDEFLPEAWQKLKKRLADVPHESLGEIIPDLEMRFRRKTFDEPVQECISQGWKQRYAGAMVVRDKLNDNRSAVVARAAPAVSQSYDDLIRSVDYYSDAMGAELLEERQFPMSGKVLELSTESVSEDRRQEVGCRLLHALNPLPPPNLEPQSRLYGKYLEICGDRAFQLYQGIDAALKESDQDHDFSKPKYLAKCLSSPWPFDRIAAYMAIRRLGPDSAGLPGDTLVVAIENELNIIGLHPLTPPTVDLEPLRFAVLSLGDRPDLGGLPAAAKESLRRVLALAKRMSRRKGSSANGKSLLESAERALAALTGSPPAPRN